MKKIPLLFALSLFFAGWVSSGQNKAIQDTISTDVKVQSEATVLYRQRIMDSLVKISLQRELQLASGNSDKTKELEAKLNVIKARDSASRAQLMQKISQLKQNARGYAVVPFRDTLFKIYTNTGSVGPSERAENISKRIKQLYNDPFFNSDSLEVRQVDYGFEISYFSDRVVVGITTVDALVEDKDIYQLAIEYRDRIRTNILAQKATNSLTNWIKRIGLVLLIIAGLWLIIFLINRAFGWSNQFLKINRDRFINGFSIKKVKIFTAENYEKFAIRFNKFLRNLAIIIVIYLSLPLLFSIFPETKNWTNTLLNWVLNPAGRALKGVVDFLPDLFTILVIIIIFRYCIKGIKYFVNQIEKGEIHLTGFHADWAQPTFRILKGLLYAFMLVLIFPYLPGSGSPAFQGVSVFIGILISFGSSSAIANIVAGMVITYMRPFRIGDRVKIGDITGDVMDKTMLVTRIRTIKNEDITVPNSTVLLGSTTNYSTHTGVNDDGLIIYTTVTIGYDVPWKNIHQALTEAALRTDMILKRPQPFVLQTSLDDFYVSYQINAYTKYANNQSVIYSNLHQNIQDCCNEAGIEIMSPHYRNQRDGNATTIPSPYLDKAYTAPPFNIRQVNEKQDKDG